MTSTDTTGQTTTPTAVTVYPCANCGYKFKTAPELARHNNRKRKCGKRELTPEDLANPNRCVHCNRTYKQHSHLTRHVIKCKQNPASEKYTGERQHRRRSRENLAATQRKLEEMTIGDEMVASMEMSAVAPTGITPSGITPSCATTGTITLAGTLGPTYAELKKENAELKRKLENLQKALRDIM